MDTRNLVAFGMLLAVVCAALLKGAISGADVKEVIMLLGGGVIGIAVPGRVTTAKPGITPPPPVPPAAIMALLVGSLLVLVNCAHGPGPSPDDPTAPPPVVSLPKDPLAPPFTPFYRHATDGGTDR